MFFLITKTLQKSFIRNFATPPKRFPTQKKKTAQEAVSNILYNTPLIKHPSTRRLLSCLVTDEPGVLSRVSGILAGRGFNIDSLVVSRTDVKELSRMTIVLNGPEEVVDQARKQLEDLVPVWAVLDYSEVSLIERELLLVRVIFDLEKMDLHRPSVIQLTQLFHGKVVDLSLDAVTIELSAKQKRIDAFLTLLKPYGHQEVVRSGLMAIPRSHLHKEGEDEEEEQHEAVDSTMLPPG